MTLGFSLLILGFLLRFHEADNDIKATIGETDKLHKNNTKQNKLGKNPEFLLYRNTLLYCAVDVLFYTIHQRVKEMKT